MRTVDEMKDGMIKAGFAGVTTHYFKLPIGPWPRDKNLKYVGRYQRLVWEVEPGNVADDALHKGLGGKRPFV